MQIIPKTEQKTTKWSGGLTTELLIYPEGSSYADRNFKYRISTATVEIETSVFTPLPDVDRTLMVLNGEMELQHDGYHSTMLSPLQKDKFKGEWTTSSRGTCTDLNLMCRDGAKGDLFGFTIRADETKELMLKGIAHYLYLYKGQLEIESTLVNEGDFITIGQDQNSASIKAIDQCEIILVIIEEF